MNNIEKAAEVDRALGPIIEQAMGDYGSGSYDEGSAAQALADAGLLVTDEIERVVAAARQWVKADMLTSTYLDRCTAHFELRQAVRAFDRDLSDAIRDELDPNRP